MSPAERALWDSIRRGLKLIIGAIEKYIEAQDEQDKDNRHAA